MAQDFMLLNPIVQKQGNFGNIDDPKSFAAMRYCVVGDTLILNDNGSLKEIDSFAPKEEGEEPLSIDIVTFNGSKSSASKVFNSGIHNILKIKTKDGFELRGIESHPVLTIIENRDGIPELEWRLTEDLEEGDFAAIMVGNQPDKNPNRIDAHAAMLGAMVAEGHTSGDDQNYYRTSFSNTEELYLDIVKDGFENKLSQMEINAEVKINKATSTNHQVYALDVYSPEFRSYMQETIGVLSRNKKVPTEILESTFYETKSVFLASLFQGDGYVSRIVDKRGHLSNVEVALSTYSKKLALQVQIMLLDFGVLSRITPDKDGLKVMIKSYSNLKKFSNKIGFLLDSKQNILDKFLDEMKGIKEKSSMEAIPFIKEFARRRAINRKAFWNLKRTALVTKKNLQEANRLLQESVNKEDFEKIKEFVDSPLYFQKVTSIESIGKDTVYSIKVDSDCHSFIGNGFVNHNTEAKLSKFGCEFIKEIGYNTVNFVPNYDSTEVEPEVMPAPFPYFLLGSNIGIAVGFTTSAIPYNFNEIADATILYVGSNGHVNNDQILDIVQGPDLPTGGTIIERKGVISGITRGQGIAIVRSKYTTTDKHIIITEIPYTVSKTKLIESIAEAISPSKPKKKGDKPIPALVPEVGDIKDFSDKKNGMEIRIRCKMGTNPEVVAMKLCKHSKMQESVSINTTAVVNGRPKQMSVIEGLGYWYEFRIETLTRKNQFLADKTAKRIRLLEGLMKIFSDPEKAITIIRKSEDDKAAIIGLKKAFKITQEQGDYILTMQVRRFAKSNIAKTAAELKDLKVENKGYQKRLEDSDNMTIRKDIITELKEFKKTYGQPRRTVIDDVISVEVINEADMIEEEQSVIFMSKKGYIKRLPEDYQAAQHRGGKGRLIGCKENDYIHKILTCSSHDDVLLITNTGKIFVIKAYKISEAAINKIGVHVGTLIDLKENEFVTTAITVADYSDDKQLIVITKGCYIKKTSLSEFSNVNKGGLIVGKIYDGDEVIDCKVIDSEADLNAAVGLSNGRIVQFNLSEVPPVGRVTYGVKAAKTEDGDGVRCISFEIITDNEGYLVMVSSNGLGKRVPMIMPAPKTEEPETQFPVNHRNTKGVIGNKLREGSELVGVVKIYDGDEIVIVSSSKVIRLRADEISTYRRPTYGSKLIDMAEGEECVSIAKVIGE